MASIQALCLRFVVSTLLVMVLLKVSSITEAAPTDVSNFESQSFDEPEYANTGSNLAVREPPAATGTAAPTRKRDKAMAKAGEVYSKAGTYFQKVYDTRLKKWVEKVWKPKKGTTKPAPGAAPAS